MTNRSILKNIPILLTLSLFAAACAPSHPAATPTPSSAEAIPDEVPIYPDAVEQSPIGKGKLYAVDTVEIQDIIDFYEDEMQALGWELLARVDTSTSTTGESLSLILVKDEVIVSIDVFTKDGVTLLGISSEPRYPQGVSP